MTIAAPPPQLRVNPALDAAKLSPLFQRHRRLHLPGVFTPDTAETVARALEQDTPWIRSMNPGGRSMDLDIAQLERMPPAEQRKLEQLSWQGAKTGFQYAFDSWRISDAVEAGRRTGSPLEGVYDLLNGPEFLGFIRQLTGERRAVYCDAQATRYRPGHFLTAHDDAVEGKNRLFAFVLGFTRTWRSDWGGLLLFYDDAGHVAEGYAPTFNSLNIFQVPQLHAVSAVAPFAGADRLSITGWIRTRKD